MAQQYPIPRGVLGGHCQQHPSRLVYCFLCSAPQAVAGWLAAALRVVGGAPLNSHYLQRCRCSATVEKLWHCRAHLPGFSGFQHPWAVPGHPRKEGLGTADAEC